MSTDPATLLTWTAQPDLLCRNLGEQADRLISALDCLCTWNHQHLPKNKSGGNPRDLAHPAAPAAMAMWFYLCWRTYLSLQTLPELLGCLLGIFHAAFNESLVLDKNGKIVFHWNPTWSNLLFCTMDQNKSRAFTAKYTKNLGGKSTVPQDINCVLSNFPTSPAVPPLFQSRWSVSGCWGIPRQVPDLKHLFTGNSREKTVGNHGLWSSKIKDFFCQFWDYTDRPLSSTASHFQ